MSVWTCSHCGAELEEGFDTCWQCGKTTDRVADPSLVRKVNIAVPPANEAQRIKCAVCGYAGRVLTVHYGYQWWIFPLVLALSCTVIGVIPLFILLLTMCDRTYRACPKCDARDGLVDWDVAAAVSQDAAEIWRAKQEADRLSFANSTWRLAALALTVFLASLIFVSLIFLLAHPGLHSGEAE